MKKYFITGVTTSGKSSVCKELKKRGKHAIDTDDYEGLSAWVDLKTGQPNPELVIESGSDWIGKYDWMWDMNRFRQMLKDNSGSETFYCGSSANQSDFYGFFDKIFLLKIDAESIKKRVIGRSEHDFGKKPGELEEIFSYHEWFEKNIADGGAVAIDAAQPVAKIVNKILEIAHA